jgi:hypothetical protein
MARLVSGIGVEQRKHTSLRTKARHYRPNWYLTRVEQYEQESSTAEEMASLLYDMERRNHLEVMTPLDVWRHLAGDERWVGEEFHPALGKGSLDTLAYWVDYIGKDLPYTADKLTPEQRQWCQQVIRTHMEALIEAFDGRGPWTK